LHTHQWTLADPAHSTAMVIDLDPGDPATIIDSLNKEINAGLAEPKLKARFVELGAEVFSGSPADFSNLVASETEKWGKVIRTANIKPE
jgi:tripartite-type tricarboxylate transporter receptor subunit TctC